MSDNHVQAAANHATAIGLNCSALHDYSFVIGEHIESTKPFELVIGTAEHHVRIDLPEEVAKAASDALVRAMQPIAEMNDNLTEQLELLIELEKGMVDG